MALFLELAPGDTLRVGASRITVEAKSGKRTRVRIDSTEDVDHVKAGSAALARGPTSASAPAKAATPVLTRPRLALAKA